MISNYLYRHEFFSDLCQLFPHFEAIYLRAGPPTEISKFDLEADWRFDPELKATWICGDYDDVVWYFVLQTTRQGHWRIDVRAFRERISIRHWMAKTELEACIGLFTSIIRKLDDLYPMLESNWARIMTYWREQQELVDAAQSVQ